MFYPDINLILTEGQDKCEAALVENKRKQKYKKLKIKSSIFIIRLNEN